MEGYVQCSKELAYSIDIDTEIDVSKVSALLVATIQEAKDRITDVEHMFCSQLFPDYQAKSINLRKVYLEARKAAETSSERENNLLLEIKKMQSQKQQVLEECQSLKLEKAEFENFVRASKCICDLYEDFRKANAEVENGQLHRRLLKRLKLASGVIIDNENTLQELEENIILFIQGRKCLDVEAEEQQLEMKDDDKDVGRVELQKKLLQLVQSNVMWVLEKERLLKEHDEKTSVQHCKIGSLEKKVGELETKLISKSKQFDNGNQSYEYLLKKINLEVLNNEQLMKDNEKEKRLLTAELESLAGNVKELQEELRQKIEELEESRNMQQQLSQQIDLNGLEMLRTGQELEELLKERSFHVAKLNVLEEKVDKLQSDLRERSIESTDAIELHGKLLKQIEAKEVAMLSEKKKRKNVIDCYKRLKSQYNFLCARYGLTPDNMLTPNKKEDENGSVKQSLNPLTSPGTGDIVLKSPLVYRELNKQQDNQDNLIDNEEHVIDEQGVAVLNQSKSDSPCTSSSTVAPLVRTKVNSRSLCGTKRSGSYWRETRSHQDRGGPDPHDDFFNTPLENIRGNLKKTITGEHGIQDPVSNDYKFHSSDDETQNLNLDPDPAPQKQQDPPPKPGPKGFKYVEPVRKKAERETLKGIECKQCKKFYDAVLPDGGDKDSNGNKKNLRCEHHEGVSRHRYRYAPPSTPEGFWNIGFESEM